MLQGLSAQVKSNITSWIHQAILLPLQPLLLYGLVVSCSLTSSSTMQSPQSSIGHGEAKGVSTARAWGSRGECQLPRELLVNKMAFSSLLALNEHFNPCSAGAAPLQGVFFSFPKDGIYKSKCYTALTLFIFTFVALKPKYKGKVMGGKKAHAKLANHFLCICYGHNWGCVNYLLTVCSSFSYQTIGGMLFTPLHELIVIPRWQNFLCTSAHNKLRKSVC